MSIIRIIDTTLRDGEQAPGCSMHLDEKIKIARQLERLKVYSVEAGFPASSKGDYEAVKKISETVHSVAVSALARLCKNDIDTAAEALCAAKHPILHVFIATSDIHLERKLHLDREEVKELVTKWVAYAKTKIKDVEFSCEDASRTDRQFLADVIRLAIKAGATIINIPDTVGYFTPSEMSELISYLNDNVPEIKNVTLSVHCHNDLGLAVANSLAAVKAGVTQVECTVIGIGERAGNAALEEVVMALKTRNDYFDVNLNVDTTQLYRTSRLVSKITGVIVTANKAVVGLNAFAHESGIHQHGIMQDRRTYEIMSPETIGIPKNKMVLGKHSGRHAFEARLSELGYYFDNDELDNYFEEFKVLCDKKKEITDYDIEAIVELKHTAVTEHFKLERFVVNSGNTISTSAMITLKTKDGELHEQVALGDGPIDAAYKAVEKIAGIPLELNDYRIHSVSDGEDALGEVLVKVSSGGSQVRGKGLSTDIIESSILAYVHAVNKLFDLLGLKQR